MNNSKQHLVSFAVASSLFLLSLGASAQVGVSGQVSGSITIGGQPPPPQPTVYQPPPPPPQPVYQPQPVYAQPVVYAQPGVAPSRPFHAGPGQDGLYFRFGLGGGGLAGKNSINGDAVRGDGFSFSGGGVAVDLSVGWTVAPGFVLGLQVFGQHAMGLKVKYDNNPTLKAQSDDSHTYGLLGFMLDWYPRPQAHGGFHVQAVFGGNLFERQDPYNGERLAIAYGFGGGLGVGYDFRIARQHALGLMFRANVGTVAGDGVQAAVSERYTLGTFSVLASYLFH